MIRQGQVHEALLPEVELRQVRQELSVPFIADIRHERGYAVTVGHHVVHLKNEDRLSWHVVLFQENAPLWKMQAVFDLRLFCDVLGQFFFIADFQVLEVDNQLVDVGVKLGARDVLPVVFSHDLDYALAHPREEESALFEALSKGLHVLDALRNSHCHDVRAVFGVVVEEEEVHWEQGLQAEIFGEYKDLSLLDTGNNHDCKDQTFESLIQVVDKVEVDNV
jgi:hypothetical protein